ncbi:hypothetical protein RR48_11057 [Papilio machaon]|uniref:Uncharacterized protein n=1 Tax=Papilio machaon TaxID=76193 RepID=A0A194RQ34_PAPMA|nr:hypothetical protein RR48_11057 [Papilio machaon]
MGRERGLRLGLRMQRNPTSNGIPCAFVFGPNTYPVAANPCAPQVQRFSPCFGPAPMSLNLPTNNSCLASAASLRRPPTSDDVNFSEDDAMTSFTRIATETWYAYGCSLQIPVLVPVDSIQGDLILASGLAFDHLPQARMQRDPVKHLQVPQTRIAEVRRKSEGSSSNKNLAKLFSPPLSGSDWNCFFPNYTATNERRHSHRAQNPQAFHSYDPRMQSSMNQAHTSRSRQYAVGPSPCFGPPPYVRYSPCTIPAYPTHQLMVTPMAPTQNPCFMSAATIHMSAPRDNNDRKPFPPPYEIPHPPPNSTNGTRSTA